MNILELYYALGGTPETLLASQHRIARELSDIFGPIQEQLDYDRVWYETLCNHEKPKINLRIKIPSDFKVTYP